MEEIETRKSATIAAATTGAAAGSWPERFFQIFYPKNHYADNHHHHHLILPSGKHNKPQPPPTSSSSLNKRKCLVNLCDDRVRMENRKNLPTYVHDDDNDDDDEKSSKRLVGGWALTPKQIDYLKSKPYEYNASAGSILEILIMQKFWIWLSAFLPSSLAPCTITGIGFIINLITCSILIWYSPDARTPVPSWTLFLAAFGVLLYQICDALDGKQCYKLQNTQLEEFYDHGCDSVSTILLMYGTGIALQAGRSPSLFLAVIFTSLFAFYSTHWLSYMTNQMIFGRIDVTEAQWTMIVIHLLSGIFGQSFWDHGSSSSSSMMMMMGWTVNFRTIVSLATMISLCWSIINNAGIILFGWRTPLDLAGVKIERRRSCHPIKPLLPALFLSLLIVYCYRHGYYHLNPSMFILAFGFNFSKLTMKLVMAHCTDHDIQLVDPTLLAPIMLALNDAIPGGPVVGHDQALLCALIWDTIELIRYFTFVSWDIRVALDIWIFRIKYPPGHPKNRCQTAGYYVNGLNNEQILKKKN